MRLIILLGLIIFNFNLFAQITEDICGWEKENIPMMFSFESKVPPIINEIVSSSSNKTGKTTSFDSLIGVPVIFHVLHDGVPIGTGENVPDANLINTITYANKYFRNTHSFTNSIDSVYRQFAADTKIELRLATRDSKGLPTTGIMRYNLPDPYSSPLPFWANYLNIYIYDISDPGIAGMAWVQQPVSIDYAYSNGEGNARRVFAHEIGHHLGMHHIWGSDAVGCVTDYVNDTPLQEKSTNCSSPTFSSCTGNKWQMVNNIMNYGGCLYMFTQGQKDRMFLTYETYYADSINYPDFYYKFENADPLVGTDVGLFAHSLNVSGCDTILNNYSFRLLNAGFDTITSVDIVTDVNDGWNIETYNWTGTLYPGDSVKVILNNIGLKSMTNNKVKTYIDNINGIDKLDLYSKNDGTIQYIETESADFDYVVYDKSVVFTNLSYAPTGAEWSWTFGGPFSHTFQANFNMSTDTSKNPVIVYDNYGSYYVKMYLNSSGCSLQKTKEIFLFGVGIDEPQVSIDKVYPNPTQNKEVNVYYTNNSKSDTKFVLRDILGREVVGYNFLSKLKGLVVLELDQIEPGVYFISMYKGNMQVAVEKLFVQQ